MSNGRDQDSRDRASARGVAEGLMGIEDLALRRGALFSRLGAMPPAEAALFVDDLVALSIARHPAATALVPLFVDLAAVAAALGQRQMAGLVLAARAAGLEGVIRLFTAQSPRQSAPGPAPEPERAGSDHVPLGRRTQLGRTGSYTEMDRLVYDQNPRVIENLLVNPRCTEREAIRITAHRPTSAAILAVVFRNQRWVARYAVKRALALNPYTAPAQAMGLLPSLLTQDLAIIAGDATLHADVCAAAETLLVARGALPVADGPGEVGRAPGSSTRGLATGEAGEPLPETAAAVAESREAVQAVAAAFLASLRSEVEAVVAAAIEGEAGEAATGDGAAGPAEDDVLEVDLVEIRDEAAAAERRARRPRPARDP